MILTKENQGEITEFALTKQHVGTGFFRQTPSQSHTINTEFLITIKPYPVDIVEKSLKKSTERLQEM